MKIIGITGPSGSGKTSVLEYLETRGGGIINADCVYRALLEENTAMSNAVRARFGTSDTKELGKLVFSDKNALRDLENITHPIVIDAIENELDRLRSQCAFTAIEAIALLDSGLADLCDAVIIIRAEHENLVERIVTRDNISRDYAETRLKNREFTGDFDYTVENNGDLANLYSQIDKIYAEVLCK